MLNLVKEDYFSCDNHELVNILNQQRIWLFVAAAYEVTLC